MIWNRLCLKAEFLKSPEILKIREANKEWHGDRRLAKDGQWYTKHQFHQYYGSEHYGNCWNQAKTQQTAPTTYPHDNTPPADHIEADAQSGSGSLSESELPLLVEVEPWELERCQCPIGVPPLDRVIEGESRLRCFQCLRPYEESKASGSLSGSDLIEGTKEQHVMMIEATEVHGNFIRQSVVYGNNAVARD